MVEDARQVFGARAGWYATSQVHRDPAALARLVAWAAPAPDARVLDVARAQDTRFRVRAPRGARDRDRPDPGEPEEAVAIRRTRTILNVDLVLADAQDLPFRDGWFDSSRRRAAHHVPTARGLWEMRRPARRRPPGDDRSVPEDDLADALQNALDVPTTLPRARAPPERVADPCSPRRVRRGAPETTRRAGRSRRSRSRRDRRRPPARGGTCPWGPAERQALGAREVGGVLHTTHWFVTVLSRAGAAP
jgi:hypothetical protein